MSENQGNPNANGTGTTDQPKQGIIMRVINGVHTKYLQFRATKVGRWVVRGGKVAIGVGALYEAYKCGQKHPEPQQYVLTEGEIEEDIPVEEPAEEENETIETEE